MPPCHMFPHTLSTWDGPPRQHSTGVTAYLKLLHLPVRGLRLALSLCVLVLQLSPLVAELALGYGVLLHHSARFVALLP